MPKVGHERMRASILVTHDHLRLRDLCTASRSISILNISGCLCTLGRRPQPTALLIAFAMRRWLMGRRPVSPLPLIRPISVIYSDIREKFCMHVSYSRLEVLQKANLVVIQWVQLQDVAHVSALLPSRFRKLPFRHFRPTQIVRCIHITLLPLSRHLPFEV